MELVKGIPITEYCDKNKLTIRERLDLFIQVCQAIQHAHQKGIIHRDIKPSNLLVTLHDGKPIPKVIDFGVAKALNARLTDKTIYTEHLQIVGTLLYMSPEQAELSGLDIDTRSDVYSLGVLLYELLTGTTPFQKAELDQAGFDEQRRIIREQDPPRASNRISSLGETATAVAEHRHTDAKKLQQIVRGDLDWIVGKALEKDRMRRYQTANDFAADVARCLSDEPVAARPPSQWYRFRKYTRRHRTFVVGAALLFCAAIIGVGGICAAYLSQVKAADRERAIAGELRVAIEREKATARELRVAVEREKVTAAELRRNAERLDEKQKRLDELLDELRLELMDKVFVAVMSGDEQQATEAIAKAQDAGVSKSWIRIFHGQLALYSGEQMEALRLLNEAVESDPQSVAATAMLAFANEYAGFGDQYGRLLTKLKDMEPEDIYDRLFKASKATVPSGAPRCYFR
jgi:hypothetical protein